MSKQDCKVFIGGLSWETTDQKLRAYFENYGAVQEAFVSYDRNTGRPRGFGFVVFESGEIADKVVATKHTIDRREVEAKKAVPKDETAAAKQSSQASPQKTRKVFVGGLAPSVDEKVLKQYFEQYGAVEDAVVMYDHENKRPRGFGFISFVAEESVDKVFTRGVMQTLHDKQIELKPAVPRDQMPTVRRGANYFPQRSYPNQRGSNYGYQQQPLNPQGYGYRGFPQNNARPPMAQNLPGRSTGAGVRQYNTNQTAQASQVVHNFSQPVGNSVPRFNGGYGNSISGKLAPVSGGYDVYGATNYGTVPNGGNNLFGSQPQNLYNFSSFPQPVNGMQNPVPSTMGNKLATFSGNIGPGLKGFGGLTNSAFNPFPGGQVPEGGFPHEGDGYGGAEPEFTSDGVTLNPTSGIAVSSEFGSYGDNSFSPAPGPGWSS